MKVTEKPRSAEHATLETIGKAPPPISLRLGAVGTKALEDLARMRRISKAEAARQAIEQAADRERKRRNLAVEARSLAEDPAYVEEAREIVKWMEELNDDSW